MPGVALSPSTRASSATRSIVHLPPHRSGIYSSRQSPLLPPPARKTDLPISSPLDQLSSPAKHQPDLNTGDMPIAGPSRPKPVPAQPINLSDDEDEFDGIEDVVPTQAEPTTGKSMTTGEHARVTLDDLFESSSDSVKGVEDEVDKEYEKAFGRSDDPQEGGSVVDLSSSPVPREPQFSSARKYLQSDTPPSPLPKTPHTDDLNIAWSQSPLSPRTKRRRALLDAEIPAIPSASKPLSKQTPHAGTGTSARGKGKDRMPEWVDEGYDDLPFPDDFDFEALDEPSGSGSTTTPRAAIDPGRGFRPSASTRAASPTLPQSRIVTLLDELDDPQRLRLITDLTEPEQEFYRNHWRRGADKASKKRASKDVSSEDNVSDEEFTGPQPPARKQSYKRGGGFRRGGFRGRGRGRGRARGRK